VKENAGRLVLRLAIGGLMLMHGVAKLERGVASIGATLASHHVPSQFAYAVFLGEVVGPLLVVLGWMTRPAAAAIAINMVVAVWLEHTGDLFHLGRAGGYALELQALYFAGAVAVALLGAGRFAVGGGASRWS
jgi:putative oxidoreductase